VLKVILIFAGYISGDFRITGAGGSGFAAQYDVDGSGAVAAVRILNRGSGYINLGPSTVLGYYSGTNILMEQSISMISVLNGGQNYVPGTVTINPAPPSGTPCIASTVVNATGSIMSATITSYGSQFDADVSSILIKLYYVGTTTLQTNTITGIAIAPGTSNCQVGMTLTSQPAGSPSFRAVVSNVSSTGAILAIQIESNGGGFLTDPALVISNGTCTCNGLPGNVLANLQGCLRPLVARGAVFSATRAYGALFQAKHPQLVISNLRDTQTPDSAGLRVRTTSSTGLTGIFGVNASWSQTTGTLNFFILPNASVPAGTLYLLEFNLTNPSPAQFSPDVSLSLTGTVTAPIVMTKGAMNAAPLLVAGFLNQSSIVSGSSTGQGTLTTITFNILPVATLYLGQYLTFTGSTLE
jgi:hypothetical protein